MSPYGPGVIIEAYELQTKCVVELDWRLAGGDHPTLYCLANQLVSLETKELGAYEAAELAQLEDAEREKKMFPNGVPRSRKGKNTRPPRPKGMTGRRRPEPPPADQIQLPEVEYDKPDGLFARHVQLLPSHGVPTEYIGMNGRVCDAGERPGWRRVRLNDSNQVVTWRRSALAILDTDGLSATGKDMDCGPTGEDSRGKETGSDTTERESRTAVTPSHTEEEQVLFLMPETSTNTFFDSRPTADEDCSAATLAEALVTKPYSSITPAQRISILSYLCDILLEMDPVRSLYTHLTLPTNREV
eukprot:Stramenopile-MAST_4_protein_6028